MELEGDVQGRQDQAQKIIEMPQRDRETSTSENQPSSASVVSMYKQEKPSISTPSATKERLKPRPFNCGGIGAGGSAECFSASNCL